MGLAAFTMLLLSRGLGQPATVGLALYVIGLVLLAGLFFVSLYDLSGISEKRQTVTGQTLDTELLPDGVILSSVNGTIRTINSAAASLVGDAGDGKNIKEVFDSWHKELADRTQADQVIEAVLSAPEIQFSEMLHLKDGRVIERNTQPVSKQGQRIWFLRDITHVQLANNDSVMHQSMVEADAARNAELAEQLFHAKAELEEKQAELTRLANTDSLTGLLNRRRFTALGQEAVRNANNGEIWVVMMDIDYFKRVNDTYGHAAGDVAIRDFARIIEHEIGEQGFVGRMGGEEFAAILPRISMNEAIRLAEAVRKATALNQTTADDEKFRFTTSIGVAQWMPDEITIEPALDRADRALYSAKAYGRNRVVGFEYADA